MPITKKALKQIQREMLRCQHAARTSVMRICDTVMLSEEQQRNTKLPYALISTLERYIMALRITVEDLGLEWPKVPKKPQNLLELHNCFGTIEALLEANVQVEPKKNSKSIFSSPFCCFKAEKEEIKSTNDASAQPETELTL